MYKLLNCSTKIRFKTTLEFPLELERIFNLKFDAIELPPCRLRFACEESIAVDARG